MDWGLLDPHIDQMPRLRQLRSMKGIKIYEGALGKSSQSCLSITPSILRKPKKVWLYDDPFFNNAMLWAVSITTFFHFADQVRSPYRRNPMVHLSYGNLAVDNAANPSVISIQQQFDITFSLISAPPVALYSYLVVNHHEFTGSAKCCL